MIHDLVNAPYTFQLASMIEMKNRFEKKYSNTKIKVFQKYEKYELFFPHFMTAENTKVDGILQENRYDDEILCKYEGVRISEIEVGQVTFMSGIDENFNLYQNRILNFIKNKIVDFRESYNFEFVSGFENLNCNFNLIYCLEQIINSDMVKKDLCFEMINEKLHEELNNLKKSRDLIYLWNISNLLDHLICFFGDSGAYVWVFLE